MSEMYTVKEGDYLAKIATEKGFSDWKKIYEHPDNAEFKQARPNPDIIFAGDRIFIPDKKPKVVTIGTDKRHVFTITVPKINILLILEEFPELPYQLDLGNGTVVEGITDAEGKIEALAPTVAKDISLIVWADDKKAEVKYENSLRVGELDPVTELRGVQARLNALGHNAGTVDGIMGSKTRTAIEEFKEVTDVSDEEELGQMTKDKLVEVYGC